MRYFDQDEAARLNAAPWQLELLKANPSYLGWGPHEDYMWREGDGWNSRVVSASWAEFGPWELDELNECVNFYFEVTRASEDCKTCGGNGYHPDAQWVSESFYSHSSPFKRPSLREQQANAIMAGFGARPRELHGRGAFPSAAVLKQYGPEFRAFCDRMMVRGHWSDDITQDEVQVLVDEGRLMDFTHTFDPVNRWQPKSPAVVPSAEQINAWEAGKGMGHDAINRMYLIKARLKRLGLPHDCPACNGEGSLFTAPSATVNLVLWWLHPRKGCSRGIEVQNIQQADLPAIAKFLRAAADRNATRFAGLAQIGA